MRCAIAALMRFLVVAAFNPERTLLNPSPKLGSPSWLSSSTRFIHFMTADSTLNSNLFFAIFVLCWFACIQSAVENLGCISDLNVGVIIENLRDWFIVCIDELTTHGSFCKDHKWIHIVDQSIQKIPQSFILILVTFIPFLPTTHKNFGEEIRKMALVRLTPLRRAPQNLQNWSWRSPRKSQLHSHKPHFHNSIAWGCHQKLIFRCFWARSLLGILGLQKSTVQKIQLPMASYRKMSPCS